MQSVCENASLPDSFSALGEQEPILFRGNTVGWKQTFADAEENRYRLERIAPGDRLRNIRVQILRKKDQPEFFYLMTPACDLTAARQLVWKHNTPHELLELNPADQTVISRQPLNPEVPQGQHKRENTKSIRVGLIDSGVNYLLPEIASRLARDKSGELIGYDFWDMDTRPFDSNPARSAFFPQRHGTRTASIILGEAPNASLVPYRYPRPDMRRMRALIEHAATHNVKIITMPLGGKKESEWLTFANTAARHPDILFLVSAGNEGRNIDSYPLYPASLRLQNMLVVTSANDWGRPAERTSWGPISVDLLTPAEKIPALDFSGETRTVSGSSYAVARIAALAARLKQAQPELSAIALKQKLFSLASASGLTVDVLKGLIADPLASADDVKIQNRNVINFANRSAGNAKETLTLALSIGVLSTAQWRNNWQRKDVEKLLQTANYIFKQCDVSIQAATLTRANVTERLIDFRGLNAKTVVDALELSHPALYLVRNSLRNPAFEAEAFGDANTPVLRWLKNSVWMVHDISHPGIALAHELFHVVTNDGSHVESDNNLMRNRTSPGATTLTDTQCQALREGVATLMKS